MKSKLLMCSINWLTIILKVLGKQFASGLIRV